MSPAPGSPAGGPSRKAQGVALALLAALVYLPSLRNGFVFDDHTLLLRSPLVRGPLWPYWFSTRPLDYQPVSYTLLWLGWRLFGTWAPGYHALDLACQVAVVLLLWRVLRRLAIPGAWLGAAIFALHPVGVPSVAWISETRNLVSAALALFSFELYLRDDEAPAKARLLGSLGAFAAAILAKGSVVVLPVFLLGAGWWRRGRLHRADFARTLPFFALALLSGLVTIWFQWSKAMVDVAAEPLVARLDGAGWIMALYLWKALVPTNLMLVYPRWEAGNVALSFAATLAVVCAVAGAWMLRRRVRGPFAWLAGVVVATLPVSGIVPMAWHLMAPISDHLQYLALMPTSAALGAAVTLLPGSRAARALAGAALLAAFGTSTFERCAVFRSDETLWADNLRRNPGAEVVHAELAELARERGDAEAARRELLEAARLTSDPAAAHLDRGQVALERGALSEAAGEFAEAARLSPSTSGGVRGLAECLDRMGRRPEAIAGLRDLLARLPDDADARAQLGVLLAHDGDLEGAVRELERAAALRPGDLVLEQRLAVLLVAVGRRPEALQHIARALDRSAPDAQVHQVLAGALEEAGLRREAALERAEER